MSATSHRGRSCPCWPSPAWAQRIQQAVGASLRGCTGQPFRTAQQIERAVDRGEVLPGDVQIPGRRIDGPVAEQKLDSAQIHPGFQQMCGKAMAQRMDACAVGDPSDPLGVGVDLLRSGDGHWLGEVLPP